MRIYTMRRGGGKEEEEEGGRRLRLRGQGGEESMFRA